MPLFCFGELILERLRCQIQFLSLSAVLWSVIKAASTYGKV
jgi:hypothetical protein